MAKGLGAKINELRLNKNMTQGSLGKLLNVSQVAVYKWEKDLTEPDSSTILMLADIFNVSAEYLLGNTYDPTPIKDLVHKDSIKIHDMVNLPLIDTSDTYPTVIHENNTTKYKAANPLEIKKYKKETLFYIQIIDDLMIEDGVPNGSFVLINQQETLNNEEIGLFKITNNKQLLLRKFLIQEKYIILKSSNKAINEPDIIFTKSSLGKDLKIIGKAIKAEFNFK